MALITRLSRLFQADFHAVLDRIEEPDIQLKQAIREMQIELQQNEQRLALLQHEAEQLSNLSRSSGVIVNPWRRLIYNHTRAKSPFKQSGGSNSPRPS